MNTEFETIEHDGLTIEIHQDMDPMSPNEWGDDSLFLIADHRDFYVPPSSKDRNFLVHEEIEKRRKTHHVFGLEAYIHSGVVLALSGEGNFPDRKWDVSQLGVVFASKEEWPKKAEARKCAEGLIDEWNKYLGGDVYGYVIKSAKGEYLPGQLQDSCWGFYGHEHAVSEAKSAAESIAKTIRAAKEKKLKAYIVNKVDLAKRSLKS